MTGPSITWVAGRRKAIARAVAIYAAQECGEDFVRLSTSERGKRVEKAMDAVRQWQACGLLSEFQAEFMEAADGGTPLVKWPASTDEVDG